MRLYLIPRLFKVFILYSSKVKDSEISLVTGKNLLQENYTVFENVLLRSISAFFMLLLKMHKTLHIQ
jgi:hypothetical protein